MEEIAESEFPLGVKFNGAVNAVGISQTSRSNLDSLAQAQLRQGKNWPALIVGHFKGVRRKTQRLGDPVLNGFTISPGFPLACPSGAVDSFALCIIHCLLLINGL